MRRTCPSPPNKTDAHLRGVAETGGLTGAVMWTPAVRHDQQPDMDDYISHVDNMVKVAGIDHVGFASDTTESPAASSQFLLTTPITLIRPPLMRVGE